MAEGVELNFVSNDVLAGEFLQGATSFSTLNDLVDKAIAEADGKCIRRLIIAMHGATDCQGFTTFDPLVTGGELIDGALSDPIPVNRAGMAAAFDRLRPHWCDKAIIEMRVCEFGTGDKGTNAMGALSDLAGVPVTAPMDEVWSVGLIGGITTYWKTVYPSSWDRPVEESWWGRGRPARPTVPLGDVADITGTTVGVDVPESALLAPPETAAITGVVVDTEGTPIPGVKVSVTSLQSTDVFWATADESGAWGVDAPPGAYIIRAWMPGLADENNPDTVISTDETTSVTLDVDLGGPDTPPAVADPHWAWDTERTSGPIITSDIQEEATHYLDPSEYGTCPPCREYAVAAEFALRRWLMLKNSGMRHPEETAAARAEFEKAEAELELCREMLCEPPPERPMPSEEAPDGFGPLFGAEPFSDASETADLAAGSWTNNLRRGPGTDCEACEHIAVEIGGALRSIDAHEDALAKQRNAVARARDQGEIDSKEAAIARLQTRIQTLTDLLRICEQTRCPTLSESLAEPIAIPALTPDPDPAPGERSSGTQWIPTPVKWLIAIALGMVLAGIAATLVFTGGDSDEPDDVATPVAQSESSDADGGSSGAAGDSVVADGDTGSPTPDSGGSEFVTDAVILGTPAELAIVDLAEERMRGGVAEIGQPLGEPGPVSGVTAAGSSEELSFEVLMEVPPEPWFLTVSLASGDALVLEASVTDGGAGPVGDLVLFGEDVTDETGSSTGRFVAPGIDVRTEDGRVLVGVPLGMPGPGALPFNRGGQLDVFLTVGAPGADVPNIVRYPAGVIELTPGLVEEDDSLVMITFDDIRRQGLEGAPEGVADCIVETVPFEAEILGFLDGTLGNLSVPCLFSASPIGDQAADGLTGFAADERAAVSCIGNQLGLRAATPEDVAALGLPWDQWPAGLLEIYAEALEVCVPLEPFYLARFSAFDYTRGGCPEAMTGYVLDRYSWQRFIVEGIIDPDQAVRDAARARFETDVNAGYLVNECFQA